MIEAKCKCCECDIEEKAGILLSPPLSMGKEISDKLGDVDLIHKIHLCRTCYTVVVTTIDELAKALREQDEDGN